MNPLEKATSAAPAYCELGEGNLWLDNDGQGSAKSTFIMSAGKWYWECLLKSAPSWWPITGFGISTTPVGLGNQNYTGEQAGSWGYKSDGGQFYIDGSIDATYTSAGSGDILQFALDIPNNKAWVGINNTWVNSGDPAAGTNAIVTSGLNGYDITPIFSDSGGDGHRQVANFGQDSSFAGNKTAQGNQDSNEIGDFYYTPPSLFLALCTSNLPDPEIALPGDNFNTVLWTGDAASSRAITGVGFTPDLVWGKSRGYDGDHQLVDSVRGNSLILRSNVTGAELAHASLGAGGFTTIDSDGFTIVSNTSNDNLNKSSIGNVAWNWKAGGAASSNGDGDITSSVSANTTAGFSIVSYTGDADNTSSVGHGLTTTPGMIILKALTGTQNWIVWHKDLTATTAYSMYLNTTTAQLNNVSYFYDAAPNATTFHPGDGGASNGSGTAYIAYCFESIEGYSKMGTFAGNGLADGTFIYTGFKPAYLLLKKSSATASWYILDNKRDTYNQVVRDLQANDAAVEATSANFLDFVSNGFKMRTSGGAVNSGTLVYAAFAESPFKYSNAR
tara:strand:+ start:23 stop:1696 length:1674 start_codon:yes stop_codon:yes gene_type:complete